MSPRTFARFALVCLLALLATGCTTSLRADLVTWFAAERARLRAEALGTTTQPTSTDATTPTDPAAPPPADSTSPPADNQSGATDAGSSGEKDPGLTPDPREIDDIKMSDITWDTAVSPAAWPITATITGAAMTRDGLAATIGGTDSWPVRDDQGEKPTIGNWVLVAKCADGRWHGSAIEWYAQGRTRCSGKRWDGTDDIKGCLSDWRPTAGEEIGIMVSGCIRGGAGCGTGRTRIAKVKAVGLDD